MTWRTLVTLAALGDLAMLARVGVSAMDKLALSIAGGLVVGLVFTRVRNGLPGRIILGLAFADLSWYTVSGAIWNIVQREGLAAVVVPAWLGACALAGLVAAIRLHRQSLAGGRRPIRCAAGRRSQRGMFRAGDCGERRWRSRGQILCRRCPEHARPDI